MNANNSTDVTCSYEQLQDVIYQLKIDEGFVSTPTRDSLGNWFIGYGFDLSAGISEREANMILEERVRRLRHRLPMVLKFYRDLSPTRQDVLINMAYNLGVHGLLKFKRMLAALELGYYPVAADEMLDSVWAAQVGRRADRLAHFMRRG